MTSTRRPLGAGRGKVFPAEKARSLLNPLRRFVQSPGRIAGVLGLGPESEVLELGCGPGYFSVELAARAPNGRVHLFDLQRGMLDMAAERLREHGAGNFDRVQGDATALPYRSGSLDAALMVTVLGEVPDPRVCLGEVLRVLKPGGRLAISEVRGDADFNPPAWTRAVAETAGFRFERQTGIRWNYTLMFVRPEGSDRPRIWSAGRPRREVRGDSRLRG